MPQSANPSPKLVVVESLSQLEMFLHSIEGVATISISMKSQNLGRSGTHSVLAVRADSTEVYLLDLLVLGTEAFTHRGNIKDTV